MNIQPIESAQTGDKIIPENAPFRESRTSESLENGRIVEVTFSPPITPFRESSAKPPRKRPNAERRSREFLTTAEVEDLAKAAEGLGRHGHRDSTIIIISPDRFKDFWND